MAAGASQLWKGMTADQRSQAAEALWTDEEGLDAKLEAMAAIARRHNFRVKFVQALPREKKVRYLVGLPAISDSLAGRLLVGYHLAQQRPMLAAFLDALGIEHDNGLITADPESPPEAARVRAAAESLRAAFPPDAVALYFGTLLAQDPDTWGALAEVLE